MGPRNEGFGLAGADEAEKEDATRMIAEKRVMVIELALHCECDQLRSYVKLGFRKRRGGLIT